MSLRPTWLCIRPLEAEVAALYLAHRLAVKPEHDALDNVRLKVVAQSLERARAVADDIYPVTDENVVREVAGVLLEMRPDCLVSSGPEVEAACVVECG